MKRIETAIEEVVIIEPQLIGDNRGYFFESFRENEFQEKVSRVKFVQENQSKSSRGVLRGLHFQREPYAQSKLIRVVKGCIRDIAVDIRKGSPTYGEHVAVELSDENNRQVFIPQGFAHGFVVLSDEAIVQYKCDNYYSAQNEGGILWSDTQLNIDWGIEPNEAILSTKDLENPTLEEFDSPFIYVAHE
ncbi:MAG: dTDP-4-dehydrorhamnose 3,5-epimerase [Rikenellaceae bacterium]